MMKFAALCFLAVIAMVASRPEEKYTEKYDGIDVKGILNNRRLLLAYASCILEKGKCTAEGKELKSHIKDALENECLKCSETQYDMAKVVFEHVINKEPSIWEDLKAKYDPAGKYVAKYEKELRTITKA